MSDRRHRTSEIIQQHFSRGDYTGWFDVVYQHGDDAVPWAFRRPHPDLVAWADEIGLDGNGQRAVVVGCGLGDDADYLAERGYQVLAFDIAHTAIERCRQRFPDSPVAYEVGDLLHLPDAWRGAFDLVFESRTIQALPWQMAQTAIHAVADLTAPGGRVLVLCLAREPHEDRRGIPWPLSRQELAHFAERGLRETRFDELRSERGQRHFRVVYAKPQRP